MGSWLIQNFHGDPPGHYRVEDWDEGEEVFRGSRDDVLAWLRGEMDVKQAVTSREG